MFAPSVVSTDTFQQAWRQATTLLSERGWDTRNLVAYIGKPSDIQDDFHSQVTSFASDHDLLTPKQVAYTIFPHGLYRKKSSHVELCEAYNRPGGMHERVRAGRWGTYFGRMTNYGQGRQRTNQLSDIIEAINSRDDTHTAAYTVTLPYVGSECVRPRGGPCLNYIAVQIEKHGDDRVVGLLAVYRNHDFLERAYGNYWGLCNLCRFLATETDSVVGPVTCVSSKASVGRLKRDLKSLLEQLP